MASTIKIKRSTTAGASPTFSTNLVDGEIAMNVKDKILYAANSTAVFELARNTADNGLVLKDPGGNTVTVQAPTGVDADYNFILPENYGSAGQVLKSGGTGSPAFWDTAGAGGDVTADPGGADGRIAVWTSSTNIEGDPQLTFDTTTNTLTTGNVSATDVTVTSLSDTQVVYSSSGALSGEAGFTYNAGTDTLNVVNIVATGDLTVQGTTTTLEVDTVAIEDPIIKLANNNLNDTVDIGWYGEYNKSATVNYAGMFRDQSDGEFYAVTGLTSQPTTTFTFTESTDLATFNAVIDGGTY